MTCEENAKHVTTDGTLNETLPFEVDRRSPSIDGSPGVLTDDSTSNNNSCTCCRVCAEANGRKLDEILDRLKHLEVSTASKSFEREAPISLEKMKTDVAETNVVTRRLYATMPRPARCGPNFEIMRRERVAKIRTMRGDDMRKFALDLESAPYESEPEELNKIVERRLQTVDKVEFIKECVFMFYEIKDEAKRITWITIRSALDSRVRRRRSQSANEARLMTNKENQMDRSHDTFHFDTE